MNAKKSWTYVEDVKDLDKVLLPSGNLVLVSLREDKPEGCVPFTVLDDLPLDIRHSSVIKQLVGGLLGMRITGPAHVVRSPIASSTSWLSSSNCLPSNLP